jgi:hypothetical protein
MRQEVMRIRSVLIRPSDDRGTSDADGCELVRPFQWLFLVGLLLLNRLRRHLLYGFSIRLCVWVIRPSQLPCAVATP